MKSCVSTRALGPLDGMFSPTCWATSNVETVSLPPLGLFAVDQPVRSPVPQAPLPQISPVVQGFLSSHAAPLFPATTVHAWFASLHEPTLQRELPFGTHGFGAPVHAPPTQTSPIVQKRPSSQGDPSLTG